MMKQILKRGAVLLLTMMLLFAALPGSAVAAQKAANYASVSSGVNTKALTKTISSTQILSAVKVRDIYSDWKKISSTTTAGRRGGNSGAYFEGKKVTTKASINAGISIKALSLELGYEVEKSLISTVRAENSDRLAPYESCAYYYRDHWVQYIVVYRTVTETVFSYPKTKKYSLPKVALIRVPQKLTSMDYGWFYDLSGTGKNLKQQISSKYEKEHTFKK